MNLLHTNSEIIEQESGLLGIWKAAELPGRICYGSIDKMTPDSSEPFVKRLMNADHGAPLEHASIYLVVPENVAMKYKDNKYSIVKTDCTSLDYYVTTNLRVLFENKWLDDLQYICEPTEYHEKRLMVRFTCDLGVSREYNRHRADSINEESTRYCDYNKEKFGAGLNIIEPLWLYDKHDEIVSKLDSFKKYCEDIAKENTDNFTDVDYWLFANLACEFSYQNLRNLGWKPQQARVVIPLDTKTSLIHTAFVSDWCHFFNLRAIGTTGAPHPQAKELAEPLMNEFISRGLVKIVDNKCIPC